MGDDGYDVLANIAGILQCSDGSEGASCLKVNSTEAYVEYMSDYSPLADISLGYFQMFPIVMYGPTILGATVTPEYAKMVYGANGTGSGLGMSALSNLGNFMNQSALAEATSAFGLPTPEVVMYPGPLGPGNYYKAATRLGIGLGEPDLDVQMIAEYAPGADVGFIPVAQGMQPPDCCEDSADTYNTAGCLDVEYYIEVLQRNQQASPPKALPKFISLSYAGPEVQYAGTYEPNNEYCEEAFAKLMAMGVILLGANSDAGASGDYMCFVDGVVGNSLLAPNYPATSPYVTSVGATMDVRMSEGSEPVVAACMAPMGWDYWWRGILDNLRPAFLARGCGVGIFGDGSLGFPILPGKHRRGAGSSPCFRPRSSGREPIRLQYPHFFFRCCRCYRWDFSFYANFRRPATATACPPGGVGGVWFTGDYVRTTE